MDDAEKKEFDSFYRFFQEPFLQTITKSGETIVELSAEDIVLLMQAGILRKFDGDLSEALKMHIFSVPEPHKTRRRFIVHTIDVNNATAWNCPKTEFVEFELMIEAGTSGYWWTADAAAYYHQIPLPSSSAKYYAFATVIGTVTLTTIPTGQRQCVGAAQAISKFLLRVTVHNLPTSCETKHQEAYIDNFRIIADDVDIATTAARSFVSVCRQYRVTLNETEQQIVDSIKEAKDFRGVRFDGDTVALTEKTHKKFSQITEDLQLVHHWTIDYIDSVFGLLIFASQVLQTEISSYYYVYKFMRRRHQQLSMGKIIRTSSARVWASLLTNKAGTLVSWLKELQCTNRRGFPKCRPVQIPVLVTDASLAGFGAMLFIQGKVNWVGQPWNVEELKKAGINLDSRCIAHLEAYAVLKGLELLCNDYVLLHLVLDNTSVIGGLHRRRSANFHLNKLIHQMARRWRFASISYVESRANPTDALSRVFKPSLDQLQTEMFTKILENQDSWASFV